MGGFTIRIILDTDKKTITVPWNYMDKLEVMNKTIRDAMGEDAKQHTFSGYIDDCWKSAIADTDKYIKTAQKPKQYKGDK